jgi:hypothetical protein
MKTKLEDITLTINPKVFVADENQEFCGEQFVVLAFNKNKAIKYFKAYDNNFNESDYIITEYDLGEVGTFERN